MLKIAGFLQASVVLYGLKSVLCAPVMAGEEMMGVIYLYNSMVSGLFEEKSLRFLEILATHAGIALKNDRIYKKMKEDGERETDRCFNFTKYLNEKTDKRETKESRLLTNLLTGLEVERKVEQIEKGKDILEGMAKEIWGKEEKQQPFLRRVK